MVPNRTLNSYTGNMAALYYSASSTTALGRRFTIEAPNFRKPVFVVSCSLVSFPSKPTKRTNYLRRKITKTLPKKLIPEVPLPNTAIDIDCPAFQDIKEAELIQKIEEFDYSEISESGNEEVGTSEESMENRVSLPARVSINGEIGKLSDNSNLRYGLFLLGAFVFQTVCAVWFFGSTDIENESAVLDGNTNSSVREVGENGDGYPKSRFFLSSDDVKSVTCVDESEMDLKIEEIQVMAREARRKERFESKKNDFESGENDEIDRGRYSKSGIEDEVENGLNKLRNKLENTPYRIPFSSVTDSRKTELHDRDMSEALLYRKKNKFKGFSGDQREKPKGFAGSNDEHVDHSTQSGNLLDDELFRIGENQPNQSDIEPKPSDEVRAVDHQRKLRPETVSPANNLSKLVTRGRKEKKKATEHNLKEMNKGKTVVPVVNLMKLNDEPLKLKGSSTPDTRSVVTDELSKGNDCLKGKEVREAKSATKCESRSNFWWLKLPYVLAILMQRGLDGEGGRGLYTLRYFASSTDDRISHIVAFEDRVDASKFCYLVKSFFEDLEDFEASIIPLTRKELGERVQTGSMTVIVVKRGQLQLYAGQPLADAEMALRSMVVKELTLGAHHECFMIDSHSIRSIL